MADEKLQPQGNQLSIELSEEVAEGVYSNLAIITHSTAEFVLDFIKVMPGMPKAKVKSRVVLTPEHAKRFLKALQDNVNKYEQEHGVIRHTEGPPPLPNELWRAHGSSVSFQRNTSEIQGHPAKGALLFWCGRKGKEPTTTFLHCFNCARTSIALLR
jgi:hypothetical protein